MAMILSLQELDTPEAAPAEQVMSSISVWSDCGGNSGYSIGIC